MGAIPPGSVTVAIHPRPDSCAMLDVMNPEPSSIDASMWPILIVRIVKNDQPEYLEREFDVVANLYETRKEPYVTVVDASNSHRPSPAHRYLQTEFRRRYQDHVRAYCRGTAIVVNSAIIRAVITAIFWIKPPDTKTKFFADMDSAIAWARAQLEA